MRGCSSGSETPCSGHANFSRVRSRGTPRARPRHGDDVDDEPVGERTAVSTDWRQPRAQVVLQHEPVDDHLDRVLELLVQHRRLLEQMRLAVDLDPREALAAEALEQVAELAFAVTHDRSVDREARSDGEGEDLLDDRLDRLAEDRPAAGRAMRPPDPRIEQPQVVVDSVTVPTVDRGFRDVVFWSIEIAGMRPSIESTSGFSIICRNWRAYALRLST